jgi:hypothetical protein
LLTLVVVPVLYSYLARDKKLPVAADAAVPDATGGGSAGPLPMPADRD